MPKPLGKVEINVFVDPDLREAVRRKAKANGWTLQYITEKLLKEWAADAPPALFTVSREKKRKP